MFLGSQSPACFAAEKDNKQYGFGEMHTGFLIGYGSGFTLANSGNGDTKDVTSLAILPSFVIGLNDPFVPEKWYSGNFDFIVEPQFFTFLSPTAGYTLGLSVLLRYNFLSAGRFVPFFDLGIGAGYINSRLDDQADGVAFYPQIGAGFDYLINDRWSITFAYRAHHTSNNSTRPPNNGINQNLALIGFKYFF